MNDESRLKPATRARIAAARQRFQHDEYLRVVSMSAESAKAFIGRSDEPVDLGPPADPSRYKPGARVFGFRSHLKVSQ